MSDEEVKARRDEEVKERHDEESPMEKRPVRARRDKVTILLALGLLAVWGMTPPVVSGGVRFALVALMGLLVLGTIRGGTQATGVAVLVGALALAASNGVLWPLALAFGVAVLFGAARYMPSLGRPTIRLGRVPVVGTLACALVTPIALTLWVQFLNPDVSDILEQIPDAPLPYLLLGAAVFVFVNALLEEWVWRGILQPRLTIVFGAPAALGIQAASFGLVHAWGFPRGVIGVLLAGIWALMLGELRRRADGLLAVVLAHLVADATIAAIVLFWLR